MTVPVDRIIGVIPARYQSTRFPGKPLAVIDGKTMIQAVTDRCRKSRMLGRVIVATDDRRILEHVLSFGGEAVLTSADIATGTDRCWAAVRDIDCDIVVNIQGDEPLIDPSVIDECVRALLESDRAVCSTPIVKTDDESQIRSPHAVKVVVNRNMEALYFSRAAIPFIRDGNGGGYHLHIGLYAYRTDFLSRYVELPRTPLELSESLEQLRILENGFVIACRVVDYEALGVDTPEDLEEVRRIIRERGAP